MKKMIRTTALLLCVMVLLGLTACVNRGEEDIPDGMQLATAKGADFRLYIPTTWNINTAYGISGGYFNLSKQSTVSVVKYDVPAEISVIEGAKERIDAYWSTYCKTVLSGQSLSGSFAELEISTPAVLGDVNAYRYYCKGIVNGAELHFVQVVGERAGAFYVFSFTVEVSRYEELIEHAEQMLAEFHFADPYEPELHAKPLEGGDAPAGMKLASNDDVAYRFYVPESWSIDQSQRIFAAYLESDRSSVSVVPYMPETTMTPAEFFEMSRQMMLETSGEDGFETFVEAETVSMGGKNALSYCYRFRVGENDYYYKQVIVAHKSMVYSLTYTAPSKAAFDAHLADVDAIIAAFAFR